MRNFLFHYYLLISSILKHVAFHIIQTNTARHVIHIGIDGLNPLCISNSSNAGSNIFLRLAKHGSGTLYNARTAIETVSAPGWVSILCSMSSSSSGVHGNDWEPPWPPYNAIPQINPVTGNTTPFPTIFNVLKSYNKSIQTAMIYSWSWLSYLGNSAYSKSVDFEKKLDTLSDPDTQVTNLAINYIQSIIDTQLPSYTFLYYHNVDTSGHKYGWCSEMYEDSVGNVDKMIGQILDVIESNKAFNDSYLIVLSSDHGGKPGQRYHGEANNDCVKVPVIFSGPSVRQQHVISTPIRNLDIAPTIMYLMGYKGSHWAWEGKVIKEVSKTV